MSVSRMVMPGMNLGEAIRLARERRGWGQHELAKHAEIHQSTLQRIESGRSADPGVSLVVKITRALGMTIEELIEGVMPKPQVLQTENFEGRVTRLEQELREVRRDLRGLAERLLPPEDGESP